MYVYACDFGESNLLGECASGYEVAPSSGYLKRKHDGGIWYSRNGNVLHVIKTLGDKIWDQVSETSCARW